MTKKVYKQKYFSVITENSNGAILLRILLLLKNKMVLRMKNFNILGVNWKIRLLGGIHEKPI